MMEEVRKNVRAEGWGQGTHTIDHAQGQALQHSIVGKVGSHDVPPFQEELSTFHITAGRGAVTDVVLFGGVASSQLPTLQ